MFEIFKVVILIYLNKIESQPVIEIDNILKETNLQQHDSDVIIQKCSAKTGHGIWEGIEKLNGLMDSKFKE